ncbi:RNA polymerase sigma factor [Pedobacter jejuensis]|uniref:Sigma-70 family RNA polymerase sigma factor n=1 Tax=Pedobacter jejuensis TaxID=1268550 RepID=A0A3N0BQ55_9SPHI|nr:sigma-70 family RNA polymerase sigma factor [Pedobacter jejuensis]RNL51178.1 sigma-70 family RNA polymerase sigma factor [Pedobacter jejuensis]
MTSLNTFSDEQLNELLKSGDQDAYIEIYERYKSLLQQHALRKLGDMDEVEDLIQELFIYIWDKRNTLSITSGLSAYLFTAVRNRVFNVYAKKKREANYLTSLQEFINEGAYTTDLILREKEFRELIEKEIAALPARMREVFLLSRDGFLTHKQIAAKLGTSDLTVTTQIRNALKILRLRLGSLFTLLLF